MKSPLYLAGFPNVLNYEGEEHICSGYITEIKSFNFSHSLDTRKGSSGSPICLIDNQNVIGIHKAGDENKSINYGTFIGVVLDKLENENIKEYKKAENKINFYMKDNNNIYMKDNILYMPKNIINYDSFNINPKIENKIRPCGLIGEKCYINTVL